MLGRGHTWNVDWWSIGVLLYEMIAGGSPYADPRNMDQTVICRNIVSGKTLFPRGFDPPAKDLVLALLNREPAKRLGCAAGSDDAVRAHPFFEGYDWEGLLQRQVAAPWRPTVKDALDVSQFCPCGVDESYDEQFKDTEEWDKDF